MSEKILLFTYFLNCLRDNMTSEWSGALLLVNGHIFFHKKNAKLLRLPLNENSTELDIFPNGTRKNKRKKFLPSINRVNNETKKLIQLQTQFNFHHHHHLLQSTIGNFLTMLNLALKYCNNNNKSKNQIFRQH